ncbi:MAG: tRNA lysidine(34) synthetase TilS [Dongiaceae bacterium]
MRIAAKDPRSAKSGALGARDFERMMQAVGPFERPPHLAVAVSGGPDSLALTLLLHGWCRRRRGTLTALTVDHGLRPESAAEARQVGRWLRARGVRHRTLRWRPGKADRHWPGGVQAAARKARYSLLGQWCRANHVLHLAVAHQLEDQAETFLLRLSRHSGLDGLAAMAPVTERDGVRLIRPLLSVPRARLVASLRKLDQPWIDDPSNRNRGHARVRFRQMLPALAEDGVSAERLAATAASLGRLRARFDDGVANLLARAARPHPAGHVTVDMAALRAAPTELSRQALAHCLHTVGGRTYAPRSERLDRLHKSVMADVPMLPATLGGCRILAPAGRDLLICREAALAEPRQRLVLGEAMIWDGRFRIRVAADRRGDKRRRRPISVGCLGEDGWAMVAASQPAVRRHPIPSAARPTLPALWQGGRPIAVPHLGYGHSGADLTISVRPSPPTALSPARFTVA